VKDPPTLGDIDHFGLGAALVVGVIALGCFTRQVPLAEPVVARSTIAAGLGDSLIIGNDTTARRVMLRVR